MIRKAFALFFSAGRGMKPPHMFPEMFDACLIGIYFGQGNFTKVSIALMRELVFKRTDAKILDKYFITKVGLSY